MAGTPGAQDDTFVNQLRKIQAQIGSAMLAPDAHPDDLSALQGLQSAVVGVHQMAYQRAAAMGGMPMGMAPPNPMMLAGGGAGGAGVPPMLAGPGAPPQLGYTPNNTGRGPALPSGSTLADILAAPRVGA